MPWFSPLMPLLAQALPVAPTAEPALPWYQGTLFVVVATVAMLVLPYLFGQFLARRLRMSDYGWKIGLILTVLTVGLVINITRWPPTLGIDLRGGVKLIYQIDQSKLQTVNIDSLVRRVADQLKTAGHLGNLKADVVPLTEGQLQITLPTTDPKHVDDVETALGQMSLGQLADSFSRIDRHTEGQSTVLVYRAQRNAPDVKMDDMIAAISKRVNPGGQREVAIRQLGAQQIEVAIPNVDPAEIKLIKDKISTAGALEFRIVADSRAGEDQEAVEAGRREINNPADDVSNGERLVARWVDLDPKVKISPTWLTRRLKSGMQQVLILLDNYNVTGSDVSNAQTSAGQGGWEVEFAMNDAGSKRMGELTGNNLPRPNGDTRTLAILLDNTLKSAATIRGHISDRGQITGDFTEQEVNFIVDVLNAGRLPAALEKEPISEARISPEMGRDTINASRNALIVSTIAVLAFMLFYYRFAGIVADLSVLFNLMLVAGLMILVHAPFTLAGLAGLVLSVGMAVDSNVLIYERMREEKERGAALRMVIRNGFGRAMATIIDTHSTTIITGIVLFLIGTEQLKGFAVTLVLGLAVNLFTAVFCGRVAFDVCERKRWLTKLKMLKLFGETKIDFVRYMKPAIAVSVLISVVGIVCAFQRGKEMFGTDFTGGTEVLMAFQNDLKPPVSDAYVRKTIDDDAKVLTDPTVQAVTSQEGQSLQYNITTSNEYTEQVKQELGRLFAGKLRTNSVEVSGVHKIEAPAPKPGENPLGNPPPKTGEAPKSSEKTGAEQKPATEAGSKGGETPPPSKAPTPDEKSPKTSAPPQSGAPAKAPDEPAKPPASKSSDGKSPDSTPAKPDATPPKTGDGKSGDGKSSAVFPRARRSVSSMVIASAISLGAAVDQMPLLLAADSPAAPAAPGKSDAAATQSPPAEPPKTPAKAATPPATPSTPAATADNVPKADASKSEPPRPGTGKAADTVKSDATSSTPAKTPDTTTTELNPGSTAPVSGSLVGAEQFIGGTEATLKFSEQIKLQSVKDLLEQILPQPAKTPATGAAPPAKTSDASKSPAPAAGETIAYELSTPGYIAGTEGERASYTWTLRLATQPDAAAPLLDKFSKLVAQSPVFLGDSHIGGRVAGDTQVTAFYALLASIAMIVVYIWIRFQNVIYGLGAVVALVHDVIVTVAALALSKYLALFLGFLLIEPFKISLNVVAALLTICGYSISDTIVIFDRIREVRGKSPELTEEMVNVSVNQTLSRTVLTVFTVLLVTTILYTSGGQAIHAFAYTMLIGLISGTYSSVYIAAPILLWLRGREAQRRGPRIE